MSALRRGDFVIVRTGGFLGWLIRLGTLSPVNHAAIALDDIHILEAAPFAGVRGSTITAYGDDFTASSDRIVLTDTQREQIAERALELVGTKYSFIDIGALALWSTLHIRWVWLELLVKRTDHMICSQFVAECYCAAGIDLVPGKEPQEVTPADLALYLLVTP